MKKDNVVSDRAEKVQASDILKNNQKEQFAGINARGISIDKCPLIPVGSGIYLKHNLKESKIVGIGTEGLQPLKPFFEVIGLGATVKTVSIGDRVLLKNTAEVATFNTADYKSKDIKDFKYHSIFEYEIKDILK